MQNEKKTRFEVGMGVVVLIEGWATKGTVTAIHSDGFSPVAAQYINEGGDYDRDNFTLDGYRNAQDHILSLYTLSEYEALQALTNSFIDGAFGSEKKQPKFKPVKGELIISKNSNIVFKVVHVTGNNRYFGEAIEGDAYFENESLDNFKPAAGYHYENRFYLPIKDNPIVTTKPFEVFKGENIQPNPISGEWNETTDLLDDDGEPVCFSKGMEVGCLMNGIGKVVSWSSHEFGVHVLFDGYEKEEAYGKYGTHVSKSYPTLYPIEQYNQIQLPKLKPIQVPKPKADVIALPSWFKGGAIIPSQYVSDCFWDKFNDKSNVLESFGKVLNIIGAEGGQQCTFYKCMAVNDGIKIDLVFNNKLYNAFIRYEIEVDETPAISVFYEKNGVLVTEIL